MSLRPTFRLRPDLIVQPQDPAAGTWVVKDPIALRFYLFGADEHFILQRLTGRHTASEIIRDFAKQRAPRRLTAERLQAFVSSLHRNGLACSETPGQAAVLLEREATVAARESMSQWTNLLAVRLPGINPDAALERLYPVVRWCFRWWALLGMLALCLTAASVVVRDLETFRAQWPRVEEFFSGQNLIWLAVALGGAKILHELAHAFTCKHFGGRCHELGLMLLVFTPCLYCNVTDAWMLRSRWQRIAISAAGIATELALASLAVLLWRATQPGAVHAISLNLIVVCSVGTLLFNGNPLLKYDGYYILSDLVGIPNLWQESRAALSRSVRAWFVQGPASVEEHPPRRQAFLTTYAVASMIYRIFLTVAILMFLYRWLEPLGLELFAWAVGGSIVGQIALGWGPKIAQWHADPMRLQRLNQGRALLAAGLAVALAAGLTQIPWQANIEGPAVLQARRTERIYVTTPGLLQESVAPSQRVKAGQVLARLENLELANELLRLNGELEQAESRVKTLATRLGDEESAAAQLLVAREIVADLKEQVDLRRQQQAALALRSPVAGVVIEPPGESASRGDARQLPRWEGTPLDRDNRGCYLERGALLCLVAQPDSGEAVVFVDENDVPYVQLGQATRVQLAHEPTQVLTGRVVEIAELNVDATPPELAIPRDIAVRTDEGLAPVRTTYQVRVELDPSDVPLLIGARGAARVAVEPQTAYERLRRWWRRTFTFE